MLKISGSPSLLGQCNYISFTNPTLDGRTIYAAVSDVIYMNNETVKIPYVVDWWQTFMFEAKYLPCQMARESVEAGIMEHATSTHYLIRVSIEQTTRHQRDGITNRIGLGIGEEMEIISLRELKNLLIVISLWQ